MLVLGCEPLDDAPIFDLRIRKGVRRHGVRLAIATSRPSALDPNARLSVRFAPGEEAEFLAALDVALASGEAGSGYGSAAESDAARLAELLRDGGEDIVILWGERRLGAAALGTLLSIAERLGLADRDGAGLLEIPAGANGRGLREAGVLPGTGPGYSTSTAAGARCRARSLRRRPTARSPRCICSRPIRSATCPTGRCGSGRCSELVWSSRTPRVLTEGIAEHANVIFPAESYAEKEGTVVHPDGRLQRLRTAIAHPGSVRAGWSVIAEIARRAGLDTGVLTSPMAFAQLVEAVPFYAGLTLEEIGGRGVRWARARGGVGDAGGRRSRRVRRRGRLPPLWPRRRTAQCAPNGGFAARDLPLDLGRARGRDLARAAVHRRPPAGRALARGRAAARDR